MNFEVLSPLLQQAFRALFIFGRSHQKSPHTNKSENRNQAGKQEPVTFETVRQLGLSLPGVEEGTYWGSPALKVDGKVLACIAVHRSSEENSLGVFKVDFEEREAMVADDPSTFYFTDHYLNYPVILVRLSKVRPDALRNLIETAWRRCAPKRLVMEFDRNRPR